MMNESAKQTVDAITSHPKTAVAVAAVFNANAWTDYAEPIIKASTSILGIIVLVLLVVKHALDIKKNHFTKGES
jgi:hypothetical protein